MKSGVASGVVVGRRLFMFSCMYQQRKKVA